jgi:hypothetical protein
VTILPSTFRLGSDAVKFCMARAAAADEYEAVIAPQSDYDIRVADWAAQTGRLPQSNRKR